MFKIVELTTIQVPEGDSIGIQAEAEISTPYGEDGTSITTYIRSPGLWGIDVACAEDYFDRIASEEREVLRGMLCELTGNADLVKSEFNRLERGQQ